MNLKTFYPPLYLASVCLFSASALAAQPGAEPAGAAPTKSTEASAKPKASDGDLSAGVLKEFNVTPDAQGLGDFLRSLQPSDEMQKTVGRLIAQLGDEEYTVRDRATKQLLGLLVVPFEQLDKAKNSPDPETSWRSKQILDRLGKKYEAILEGVLRTIAQKQVKGLAKELLATMPLCSDEYSRNLAEKALQATLTAADVDAVRQALKQDNVDVRVAAAAALGQLLGQRSAGELKALLAAPEDRVRLAAAQVLAAEGDRVALEPLGKLLAADEMRVRLGAIHSLRGLTGEKIAYIAYDKPPARQEQIDQWQRWIAEEGTRAKLQHPLREPSAELGRTLICFYGSNKIVELGSDGNETWKTTAVPQPWCCQGLPNGHRLAASLSSGEAVEFDESGKKVWEASGIPLSPFSIERLENGNTLFSCFNSQKLVEIDQAGKQVAEIVLPGQPWDAHRLPDGTTLVATRDKVVEVDGKGKELWSLRKLSDPVSAQRLENGNTLVTERGKGRLVEFDRAGKEVWSQGGFTSPYDAQRLPDGNTLVAFNQGVREIDRDGKKVWEKIGGMTTCVSHF